MEIDPSLRSRMTFNKNMVNNHEAEYQEENDEEIEEDDANFWQSEEDQVDT